MSATEAASPADNLANLILALLAPMFLWSTGGDIRLAYTAAAQTMNEYRVTNRLSLFTVAKIIAFDIATLSSLSLSMYEEVSMLLALRLRGNASSLDRSGERNRRLLELDEARHTDAAAEPIEVAVPAAGEMVRPAKAGMQAAAAAAEPDATPAPVGEAAAVTASVPVPRFATAADRTPDEQQLAEAKTCVAEGFAAGLADVPPEDQWKEMARLMALTSTAGELVSGSASPTVAGLAAD